MPRSESLVQLCQISENRGKKSRNFPAGCLCVRARVEGCVGRPSLRTPCSSMAWRGVAGRWVTASYSASFSPGGRLGRLQDGVMGLAVAKMAPLGAYTVAASLASAHFAPAAKLARGAELQNSPLKTSVRPPRGKEKCCESYGKGNKL